MTLEPGHGMPGTPGRHGSMRSSTADRERYRSQTYAELAALTADLPAGPLGAMPHHVAGPPVPFPVVAPRRPVNSMAVVALICSLIPGIPAAAAIITGVLARSQIRETGERGVGLATAAVVIGSISLLGFLLFLTSMMGLS